MFKKRIKRWGLDKNLKQHEVEHILGILAERKAQGKETYFALRGRVVDLSNVRRFQQRKKLTTSDAIANYRAGRSKECQDLRPLTPQPLDPAAWETPDQAYEDTLRAFGTLFHGLVDTRYYWMESNEIVMPPSTLRGEVSDVCANLAALKSTALNVTVIRKLSLLMESIVHSRDAWIHCRLIYMLWIISTTGHIAIAKSLLAHMNGLITTVGEQGCAQYRFVKQYCSLEPSRATRLAGDMISLKAEMVGAFHVDNRGPFKLRSLEYDVFWRQREQGIDMSVSRSLSLLQKCQTNLGLLAIETLTILRIVLEDFVVVADEIPTLYLFLEYLSDTRKLSFCEDLALFIFDGQLLNMEAACELARVYCKISLHKAEAWVLRRVFSHYKPTASGLRREYDLLLHVSRCVELHELSWGKACSGRKREIECNWEAEVEALVSTDELLSACSRLSRSEKG